MKIPKSALHDEHPISMIVQNSDFDEVGAEYADDDDDSMSAYAEA
jgi:hypothetical protein